ncbi:MAG TPA: glycosyltransferase family 2 protein [Acidimicrobiia bacterium]
MRTLIIIPAYNEEAALPAVLQELADRAEEHDVLVVDDGSSDHTTDVAKRAGATVMTLPFNLGVGGALRAGFRYAVACGYDRSIQFDADGQHDPAEIKKLLHALDEGADMAIGNRFGGDVDEYDVGAARGGAMAALRVVVRLLTGRRFSDTTSGFRAFNRPVFEMFARELSVEYMGDTVEALLLALAHGFTVVEVPTRMRGRAGGAPSQRNLRLVYRYLRTMLVLACTASRRRARSRRSAR